MIRTHRTAGALLAALLLAVVPLGEARAGGQEPGSASDERPALLDVPFFPQSELLCGGAAAAMVLRYWGSRDVRPEDFRSLVRQEEGGIRAADLAREVRRRGWRSIPFEGEADEVRRQVERGRPVIALLEVEPRRHHFVVVVAWTEDGVIYHDPADAPFRVLSRDRFEAAWEPAGRWGLVVLPSGDSGDRTSGPGTDSGDGPGPDPDEAVGSIRPDDRSPCTERIREGVRRARAGDLDAAGDVLTGAVRRCPGSSARARTELAGVRARQERWDEARRTAELAVERDPSDHHAWRILATSRFLTGDPAGALAAWNRIGEPAIDRIRVEGMERTPDRVVHRRLGLSPDRVLSPASRTRAARRLELLPAAYSTRVGYRPVDEDRVEVEAAVFERPAVPATAAEWSGILARAAAVRELTIRAAGIADAGELWTGSVRLEERRPRAWLSVAVPDPPLAGGVAELAAGWERQSYRIDGETTVEERRRAALVFTDWLAARLLGEAGVAVDRWSAGSVGDTHRFDGTLAAALELRPLSGRLSVRAEGSVSTDLQGAPGSGYRTGALRLAWRSSTRLAGPVAYVRLSGEKASAAAPLAAWPGAGAGRARNGLLRAHPLLEDGVVAGPGFGRSLVHGGVEGVWWFELPVPLPLGAAAFADVARPADPPGSRSGRLEIDAGMGLRLGVPGAGGILQLDVAEGLRSGGSRIHVGWEAAWPSWGRR